MLRISWADRCIIFIIQTVAIAAVLVGLYIMKMNSQSPAAIVFLVFGAIITLSVILGLLCNNSNETEASASSENDPPPKYRLTWRKEFFQAMPEHLKADIEKTWNQEAKQNKKNKVTQIVWTSDSDTSANHVRSSTIVGTGVQNQDTNLGIRPVRSSSSPAGISSSPIRAILSGASDRGLTSIMVQTNQVSSTITDQRETTCSRPGNDMDGHSTQCTIPHAVIEESNNMTEDDDALPSYEESQRWF